MNIRSILLTASLVTCFGIGYALMASLFPVLSASETGLIALFLITVPVPLVLLLDKLDSTE
jgi:hypothetical protein